MSNLKVILNRSGVREMLKSAELQQYIDEQAQAIKNRAGSGYETKSKMFPERCAVRVSATTNKAQKDNLNNNTLLKAMGGGKA